MGNCCEMNNYGNSTPGSGDVTGPASSGDGNIAVFNGITGKVIKDGGPAPEAIKSVKLDASINGVFFTVVSGSANFEFGWDATSSQPYLEELGGIDGISLEYIGEQVSTPFASVAIKRSIESNFVLSASTRTYFSGDGAISTADPIFKLGSGGTSDHFSFVSLSANQATINTIFHFLKVVRLGLSVWSAWDFNTF